jgi:glycosyltransferase involved in cell wall biosynthesis
MKKDQTADASPPSPFALLGYVDYVNSEVISGWACNAANLNEFVQVDVKIDGSAVDEIIADRPRPDVAEAGAGHSNCGFLFQVPNALKDGKQHDVECLVSGHILPMGENYKRGTVFEKDFRLSGYVESFDGHAISGWACNAADQHEFVKVDIKIDGVSAGTIVADGPRKDVADAGVGHGNCGFFWLMPASLKDGKKHEVACFVAGRALSMPEALSKPVYFAVSEAELFPLGHPKQFTHILSDDSGMPDFSPIRSAAGPSKSVIVALIDTPGGWSDFGQKAASGAFENFDVLIALREKHFINAFQSDFHDINHFSLVEYASRMSNAGILQHIQDSSILLRYERIIFLNYADDTFPRDGRVDQDVIAANSDAVGVVAGDIASYSKCRTPESQLFLNIVLPRFGSGRPQADFSILLKSLRDSTPSPLPSRVGGRSERGHLPVIPAGIVSRIDTPEVRAFPGRLSHMDGRPNILLVAHTASEHLFGSERSLLDMIQGMASLRANVFVALPRHIPDYTNMIRERCYRVLVTKYGWWRKNEASSDAVRQTFRRIILTNDIQVVHANTIMVRECLEAARECGVAGVVHVRELITHDKDLAEIIGLSVDDIVNQVIARSDWIVGNSKATAQVFSKPGMTFVIPNTTNMDAMDVANQTFGKSVRFGLISSNIPKKGILDFVNVAKACAVKAPNAEFWLIGPETQAIAELKAAVECGSLPPNLRFPGYSANPRDAVSQVNVVLNLSNFAESFGRTVLEAMAARRPVIAYRWGALGELVEHGRTGYLVDYKDVDAVARHVQELSKDPDGLLTMGANARQEAVASFGFESYGHAFKEAYSNILPKTFIEGAAKSQPIIRPARRPDLKSKRISRVAYFCWHFPVPSETFVLNELRVLVAQGVDVIVFCKQSPHKTFKVDFPIEIHKVDSPQHLARRLKETSRTIVHAHFTYPTVTDMVWPACEEAQIPFTFIAHAQDIFVHKNDDKNRLAEIGASKWCLKLFTLSRFHLDYVVERGFPRNKVVINPNAVELAHFSAGDLGNKESRKSKRVVAIHRFVEKKGLASLIKAAPLLESNGVQIDIHGYGPLEDEFKGLVASLGSKNVTIHGQLSQDQIPGVLRDADLFACPSIRTETGDMDGIPTSIIESMAAGVPVLTTSVAGIPELVEDGITGIVCDATPESIAAAILRFYDLHPLQVRAIIDEARKRAVERHDALKLVDTLRRVWDNDTVDIVIVSWNGLRELRMVVDAILANTALQYHLIICDNLSQKENVGQYLDTLWAKHDNVTVVHNNQNSMVGPGTNLALAQGSSEYIIYVCGKEGVSFANGWEQAFIRAFTAEDIGLVGSIGYSPTYLTGAQYPKGIRLFDKFRNREFAMNNPAREFGHVQGGLFAMRRKMVDQIGGFSNDVPHDYTDVEYSFYAESRSWRFGEVDHVLALFNKSRPSLSQRFRDDIKVAHPVLPDQLPNFQGVIDGRLKHCNICDWFGPDFHSETGDCPLCGSGPLDRSLFRWLSDSTYLYRRLPAISVGLAGKMEAVWTEQFQGPRLTLDGLTEELRKNGRLPNSPGRLHLAVLRVGNFDQAEIQSVSKELRRLLVPGATVVFQHELIGAEVWDQVNDRFKANMLDVGFVEKSPSRYSSRAVAYSFLPLQIYAKASQ